MHSRPTSWPDLFLLIAEVGQARLPMPSTPYLLRCSEDVDARDKRGHDGAYPAPSLSIVMRGPSSVMRGLGPRIHDLLFCDAAKTWMPGIKPGMTNECTAVPAMTLRVGCAASQSSCAGLHPSWPDLVLLMRKSGKPDFRCHPRFTFLRCR